MANLAEKSGKRVDLPCQRHQIPLNSSGLFGALHLQVNLVEIAAGAQEHAARAHGCEAIFFQSVITLDEVLNAIGFGHEAAAVEGIDEDLGRGGLKAADEMPRQADASEGQAQTFGEQQIQQAQGNRVAGAAIQHAIQKAVIGIVVVLFVAAETELLK